MTTLDNWNQPPQDGEAADALGLDLGAMDAMDPSFAAPQRGSLGGLLVLAAVLVIGAGTLWVMRMAGGVETQDKALAGVEQRIETALKRLQGDAAATGNTGDVGSILQETDQIIAMFADDPSHKQVALSFLQKNPFDLFLVRPAAANAPNAEAEAIDRAKAERLKKLRGELNALKLQSMLHGGAQSLAVIGGKVVREGETIGSFAVISITPNGVLLSAEGNTYTLSMEQPADRLK